MMSGKSPRCCKRAFADVDQLRGRHATPIGLQPFNSCRLDQPLDIDGDVNLARPKLGFTQIDRYGQHLALQALADVCRSPKR
jgi:hypothetical protein